ncbi:MAG: hypothetical protein NTY61_01615 [Candidatus Parcubacteria bacterium]|nr:hypothetical protein [Candidatus Parcubacteria bacterium]
MKIEVRDFEIELIPETDHERDALVRLHRERRVEVKDGKSLDRGHPPDPRQTNVILVLTDPNKW